MVSFRLCLLVLTAATAAGALAQPATTSTKTPPPDGMVSPLEQGGDTMVDVRKWLLGQSTVPKKMDIDPELLKDLMEKLPKEQANPEQIQQFLKANPQFKDPEFLKNLGQMAGSPQFPKNLQGKLPHDVSPPQIEDSQAFKDNVKQLIESGKTTFPPEGGPKLLPPDPKGGQFADPPTAPEMPQPNYADNEWVKWMQKHFGESEAGKAAVKDLMSAMGKQDMKGMFDKYPELKNGGWKDLDKWGKANAGDLWKIKPPNVSGEKFTPPKLNTGSGGGGPSLGGGGGGTLSGPGLGGGGVSALAIIAAIAGAIFLAVLWLRKWKAGEAERACAAGAGRGGIDFDSIRSREELVHAFDHVSLEQMGEGARAWNHRVIADQIAEVRPAHAEPADQLAGLYERARYAPLDEDLTPGEFSDARRDLRVIAGVAP